MSNLISHIQQDIFIIEFGDNSLLNQQQIKSIEAELLSIANRSATSRILVDLANVEFISSEMIGVFIRFKMRVVKSGATLKLCSASTDLQELLRVTKLDSVFDVYENRTKAINSFLVATR